MVNPKRLITINARLAKTLETTTKIAPKINKELISSSVDTKYLFIGKGVSSTGVVDGGTENFKEIKKLKDMDFKFEYRNQNPFSPPKTKGITENSKEILNGVTHRIRQCAEESLETITDLLESARRGAIEVNKSGGNARLNGKTITENLNEILKTDKEITRWFGSEA